MPSLTIRVGFSGGLAIGHGKITLLETIAATGSISAAARQLGMSYRRAWLLIDDLNHGFRLPLVLTSPGGKRGGGATLTETGDLVVRQYRAMEKKLASAASKELAAMGKLTAATRVTPRVKPPAPPTPRR